MDGLRKARRAYNHRIGRAIGLQVQWPRHTSEERRTAFHEAEIMAQPVDTSTSSPIQNGAGVFYFMLGVSPLGVDPLAPMD